MIVLWTILTAVITYYLASFIQTIFHLFFGHTRRIGILHDVHVAGHHAQYARELVTDEWIPAERQVIWYYAIPFAPIVATAFWLLPIACFVAHVAGLTFAVWWHIYLHQQYHIRGSWLGRFEWFRRKQHLHFIHHRRPRTNYAIVEYSWDRLFRTYEEHLVVVPIASKKIVREVETL